MGQSANVVRRQEVPVHIIAFCSHDCVQRADPHPAQEPRNFQEPVEGGGQLIVPEQLPLEVVLTNLTVDLAVARLFPIGIFLSQIFSQAKIEVYL